MVKGFHECVKTRAFAGAPITIGYPIDGNG
jgi:hypothetical protein